MDTTLLIVRHGQSETNPLNIFAGHLNPSLTELGKNQAEALAAFLDAFPITVAYTSDLSRAFHTAEITAVRKGIPLITDPRLREINAGVWQGKQYSELTDRDDFKLWLRDIGLAHPEGGESTAELLERVLTATQEIAARHRGETVLVSTHATPLRLLQTAWLGLPISAAKDLPYAGNAAASKVIYKENGEFEVLFYGKNDFLGEYITALPTSV